MTVPFSLIPHPFSYKNPLISHSFTASQGGGQETARGRGEAGKGGGREQPVGGGGEEAGGGGGEESDGKNFSKVLNI